MSVRFDNRKPEVFKANVYFATMIEKYFFNKWLDICPNHSINIESWADAGCGNDGEFIAKGKTGGADYKVTGSFDGHDVSDHHLEMKWCSSQGKLSLKKYDLKAYVDQNASILFIYNTVKQDNAKLKMPRPLPQDREKLKLVINNHIKLLESKGQQFKWGIMWADRVKELYNADKWEPIPYMGNKPGVILKSKDFHEWFEEVDWVRHA
tara:strand:+ start:113 stop:736 length:624 start_codon:yes stop_codon:yes gene_type:complete